MSNDTLKNRTARSSINLLRMSLRTLRTASKDLTVESNIEIVLRESDVLSGIIKRLSGYLDDSDTPIIGAPKPIPSSELSYEDRKRFIEAVNALKENRICAECNGVVS